MELQRIDKQQEISQKENLANFVHAVADMEVRAYTLRETIKKCLEEEKKAEIKLMLATRMADSPVTLEKIDKDIEKTKRQIEFIGKPSVFGNGCFIFISTWLCFAVIVSSVMIPFSEKITTNWQTVLVVIGCLIVSIGPGLLLSMLVSIIPNRMKKKDRQLEEYCLERLEKERLDTIQKNQDAVDTATKEYEHIKNRNSICIPEMQQAIESIEQVMKGCYKRNIIRPAYRNLVCVNILDEIFINDKADTMREAMLLCDIELRHHELMGKLDEVVHALKKIGSSLSYMNHVLDSINTNVSMISQDIYKMTESQERIAYAAESVQKSAENADMYIYQRRTGMI